MPMEGLDHAHTRTHPHTLTHTHTLSSIVIIPITIMICTAMINIIMSDMEAIKNLFLCQVIAKTIHAMVILAITTTAVIR